MAADEKWYFTKEQLQNTPSRRCGFDADKELSHRQQAANFIQDMGQKLQVSQLCINTAIVYMHRFYMYHSFTHFPWNTVAAASFFLAAKVEEQPRKLEHVIRIANHCLHREQPVAFDAKSEQYAAQSQDLVFNENVLLQTLGFDVAIDHPHTHVVRCCHLVRASKDLAQTSYFMASNSLHLTTMCLQYKPTVVACFCIYLASKWSNWQIPKSNEGKDWYYYVDKTVTAELLEQLTSEFLKIFDKCPSRLKRKISSININQNHNIDQLHSAASSSSPFDPDSKRYHSFDSKDVSGPTFHRSHHDSKQGMLPGPDDIHKKTQRPHDPQSSQHRDRDREYREKKEKERLEREKAAGGQHHKSSGTVPPGTISSGKHMPPVPGVSITSGSSSKPHHRLPPGANVDPQKIKMHQRPNDMSMSHREHSMLKPDQQSISNIRDFIPNGRESTRESLYREREHQKRLEYLQQQRSSSDNSNLNNHQLSHSHSGSSSSSSNSSDLNKMDPTNRQKLPPDAKMLAKMAHENRHRREIDSKYAQKPPQIILNSVNNSEVINKMKPISNVVSSAVSNINLQDNKNLFNKPSNSTSQRHKSPFSDTNIKSSVPQSNQQINKSDTRNGASITIQTDKTAWPIPQQLQPELNQPVNNNATNSLPQLSTEDSLIISPPLIKKPSLFSPEKTPPQNNSKKPWTDPKISLTKKPEPTQISTTSTFGSPPPIQSHPKLQTPTSLRRNRSSSSGSEPELRPVVKKLDQISGFENIIRDSKMGIKLLKVPDIIQPISDRSVLLDTGTINPSEINISKELKPPDIIKPFNNSVSETTSTSQQMNLVNGIETDPVVISTLLKEAPAVNNLTDETVNVVSQEPNIANEKHKSEHHHKSEKKKKKDKHKHKDKEKNREEKKKKHKDKERHKSKSDKSVTDSTVSLPEAPLRITISKNKLEPIISTEPPPPTVQSIGLKVKISRDKIKADSITTEPLLPPPSALKIKISKDHIQYNSAIESTSNNSSSTSNSRKREREKITSLTPPPTIPPTKIMKTSYNTGRESRQNGRNNYTKVAAQLGEGETTQLRLAESKYHSKGASKTS